MKTFLKLSVVLAILGILVAIFALMESVKKTGEIPKTPPPTQQIDSPSNNQINPNNPNPNK